MLRIFGARSRAYVCHYSACASCVNFCFGQGHGLCWVRARKANVVDTADGPERPSAIPEALKHQPSRLIGHAPRGNWKGSREMRKSIGRVHCRSRAARIGRGRCCSWRPDRQRMNRREIEAASSRSGWTGGRLVSKEMTQRRRCRMNWTSLSAGWLSYRGAWPEAD